MSREHIDIDPFVAYCHITTWVGTSIGAQHYYAKIKFGPSERWTPGEDLMVKLSHRMAVEHNKGLRREGRPSQEFVKAGEWTSNFATEDDVRARAIEVFREGKMRDRRGEKDLSLRDAVFLVEGESGICQPQSILVCVAGYEDEMNILNALFTEGDGWWWERDKNSKLDRLSEDWYAIMKAVERRRKQ